MSCAIPGAPSTRGTVIATPSELRLAIEQWVGSDASGQIAFYSARSRDRLHRSDRTRLLTTLSFFCGALLALMLALFQSDLNDSVRNLAIAFMGLLPFLAAVRQSYANRILERELIVQYSYMNRIFHNSKRLLDRSRDPEEQQAILRALGEAALEELGAWIMRQRERPISGTQLFQIR